MHVIDHNRLQKRICYKSHDLLLLNYRQIFLFFFVNTYWAKVLFWVLGLVHGYTLLSQHQDRHSDASCLQSMISDIWSMLEDSSLDPHFCSVVQSVNRSLSWLGLLQLSQIHHHGTFLLYLNWPCKTLLFKMLHHRVRPSVQLSGNSGNTCTL